ncbi:hypothetical protein N9A86_03055 [Akkermansiaceae bacterium]|nr:hypothetical protein [Akkermansiaceae bacterium]MDB4537858.1 hypothetical protein [Akkermansiaceae bacterium]
MGSIIAEVLIDILFQTLFQTCCGWLGHWVVRILTLGKVQIEYGDETSSCLAGITGVIFLIAVGMLIWVAF